METYAVCKRANVFAVTSHTAYTAICTGDVKLQRVQSVVVTKTMFSYIFWYPEEQLSTALHVNGSLLVLSLT